MATDKECVDYARECVRLAEMANDPQIRQQLLQLADDWMAIAKNKKGDKASDLGSQPIGQAQLRSCLKI
jgi:NADH:ubiquinone oxidoreductase subunit D